MKAIYQLQQDKLGKIYSTTNPYVVQICNSRYMLGKDHLLQLQDIQEVLNLFNEDDNGILKITCYFEEYLGVASV